MQPEEALKQLKACYFDISWARPQDAECGWLSWSEVQTHRWDDQYHALVDLGDVARGECSFGQSSTHHRSNMRRLQQDFPDVFTEIRYSHGNVLAVFVDRLTEEALEAVCGLRDYALYDESDVSALEDEEIGLAFDEYLWQDVDREISEATSWAMVGLGKQRCRDIFYQVLHGIDYYPDHNGFEVVWDMETVAGPFAQAINSASRSQDKSDV